MPQSTQSQKIEKLLLEHLELAKKIEKQNTYIKKKIRMMVIFNYIKWVIILIPIILGIIYIPAFIKDVEQKVKQYPLLGQAVQGSGSNNVGSILQLLNSGEGQNIDFSSLLEKYQH